MASFSWLTIVLLFLGWLTHWLVAVRKAAKAAADAKRPVPNLFDYWIADRYTTMLSVISLFVFYFVVPYLAGQWPLVALAIGTTAEDPLNPLAAYLGGTFSPWLADVAGKRISAMVGSDPPVILQHPHPALRQPCAAVTEFGQPVRDLADRMWEAMQAHHGVGLAANQLGVSLQVVVLVDGPQRLTLVNPRILRREGEQRLEEGCLSIKGGAFYLVRTRPRAVLVEFCDVEGVPRRRKASGLLAASIAHELDHLEGLLFIDAPRRAA